MSIMRKYTKIYIFLIALSLIAFNAKSQSDASESSEGEVKSEIVKIAYGEQDQSEISASIATISGKDLLKGSLSNFGNSLFGKLSGLFVSQNSGEPGNDFPTLRMRGATNAPMVIIDGFERDMTYIAPEEIESVTVLKDASALAIYGMKGANGVIQITTKRGNIQQGKLSVSIQTGVSSLDNMMGVLDAGKYMQYYNQAAINDGLPAKYSDGDIAAAGTSPRYPDVNWQELILKDFTNISKANFGLQGGSDFIRYFVNLGVLYNNGVYKPTNPDMQANANLTRLNVRSNIDIQVSKNTLFSMDLAGSIDKNTYPADNAKKLWTSILTLPPNEFNAVNPDGSYGGSSLYYNNPLGMLEQSGNNTSLNHFLNASFRLKQDLNFITDGLSASIGYVIDNGAGNGSGKWRYFEVKQIANGTGENYEYYSFRENTQYNQWSNASSQRYMIFDGDLRYNMPESNGNKLDVLVRFQTDQQYRANSDLSPYLTNNYAARIHYANNDKYLLDLSASYFGSDQYAEGQKYGFFPAASAGWVFSNEGFAADSDVLNYGKLKGSYGLTGYNRYVNGRYPYVQFYGDGADFPLGTDWNWFYGIQPGKLANRDTQWEISKKLNVGLELELFNKLTVEADYYINNSTNVLYTDYNHPAVTGANFAYENIGDLTFKGIDAKVGYRNVGDDFSWFTNVVFSYYNSMVNEMGESINEGDLAHLNRTGNPVSAIFGYQTDGTFESASDISSSATQAFGTPRVGDFKYIDQNGDNFIDSRDMVVVGNDQAKIDLGWNIGVEYKNFDLEAMFHSRINYDININGNWMAQPFIHGNAANEIIEEEGFPLLSLSNMNNYQSSDYWIRKGDFLKLRNLELGYTLSETTLDRIGMEKVRFFLRGVNMLTLSNWKYTDPEYVAVGYPPMKSYLFGVNINF